MHMTLIQQIAQQFRAVHTGGNWTSVNLQDVLADVTFQEATTPVGNLHTIAVLTFHVNYYVSAVLKVLRGAPLQASDKFSFDLPPLNTEADWRQLVSKTLEEATAFAEEIEKLPEERLMEVFEDEKYGNYYRNITGIIEHTHYHLGQMSIIKKVLRNTA